MKRLERGLLIHLTASCPFALFQKGEGETGSGLEATPD